MKQETITAEELLFWDNWPGLLPLYALLRNSLARAYPDLRIKVSKSQISFYNRRLFAMASPPVRRRKDWPKTFLLVSFGLPERLEHPRVAVSTEPYPNRWTHHVLVERPEDIDGTLLSWLDAAYQFSDQKR